MIFAVFSIYMSKILVKPSMIDFFINGGRFEKITSLIMSNEGT